MKEDLLDVTGIQCDVVANSERADVLRECKLVIWDEFSMMHRQNFEASITMLQKIRRDRSPSAGLVIICLGDFRQIPPVIKYGSAYDTTNASMVSSSKWKYFEDTT